MRFARKCAIFCAFCARSRPPVGFPAHPVFLRAFTGLFAGSFCGSFYGSFCDPPIDPPMFWQNLSRDPSAVREATAPGGSRRFLRFCASKASKAESFVLFALCHAIPPGFAALGSPFGHPTVFAVFLAKRPQGGRLSASEPRFCGGDLPKTAECYLHQKSGTNRGAPEAPYPEPGSSDPTPFHPALRVSRETPRRHRTPHKSPYAAENPCFT